MTDNMTTKLVYLNEIDIENSPKVRAQLNEEVAADYGNLIKAKVKLPNPVLFQQEGDKYFFLADGLHRITGAKIIGDKTMVCEIRKGGFEEALTYALTCNTTHGLRRTQADKKRSVEAALAQWPKLSDTELGKRAQVDHKTVAAYRKAMEGDGKIQESATRETRTGIVRAATRKVRAAAEALGNSLKERTNGEAPEEFKDSIGRVIPKELVPLWQRIPECQNLIDTIRSVKGEAEIAQKDEDPMWAEVTMDNVIALLNEVTTKLKVLIPYAVCTNCQGKLNKKCSLCHGRGLISKFRWDTVPEETQKLVIKEAKEAAKGVK